MLDEEKKLIGEDVKTVQYGWPIGMPLVRKLCDGIWEIRTHLHSKISRILITLHDGEIAFLHGLIKKTQKTPGGDLELAIRRMKQLIRG